MGAISRSRHRQWALVVAFGFVSSCLAAEGVLLRTSFEEGTEGPVGWTPSGAAVWASFARTGKRSLEIRTWQPDDVMNDLEADLNAKRLTREEFYKKAFVEPSRTRWESDPVECSGKPVKVSLWVANNMTWGNDESFRAEVALCPVDANGKSTENFLSDKAIQFPQLPRDNYQLWSRAVPEGLRWEYREAVLTPPKGKARVVLHFLKFPAGQVWIDDLVVSESEEPASRAPAARGQEATRELPWEMQINFPVSFNIFRKGEPLELDLALIDPKGLPQPKAGMKAAYKVRDFDYRLLASGELKLGNAPFIQWKPGPWADDPYFKQSEGGKLYERIKDHVTIVPLTLPDSLDAFEGKLLFLHVALMDGRKVLAEDEVTFAILVPAVPDKANLFRGGKVVPNWQPSVDYPYDFGKEGDYNGFAYKCGAQWNSVPYTNVHYGTYMSLAKTKDSPLSLPKIERSYPDYGIHVENYVLQMYRKYTVLPEWAIDQSPEAIAKYGYKVFDKEHYANFVALWAKNMLEMFPNGVCICPTAGEVPHDKWRFELQEACYKAIKRAAPQVKVGAWYWGQERSEIEPVKDYLDFIDGELYGDPQGEMGQGVGQLAQRLTKEVGRPIFGAALEGCAMTGSDRQEDSAKGVFDFHVRLWERGVLQLGQFEFGEAYTKPNGDPLLRADLYAMFGGTGHFGGAKRLKLTRYDNAGKYAEMKSLPGFASAGRHFQPSLPAVAFANVIRFLDSAEYKSTLSTGYLVALLFERLGRSVLFLETAGGAGDRTVELSGLKSPFEVLDILGYRYRIEPKDGKALLTIGKNPLVLTFDGTGESPAVRELEDVEIVMTRPIVRKSAGIVTVALGAGRTGVCSIDLDPMMKAPKEVEVAAGKPAEIEITPREERPSGAYRTYIRLLDGGKAVGLLSFPMEIKAAGVWVSVAAVPMTKKTDPKLVATVHNSTSAKQKVAVRFRDIWTAADDRPVPAVKEVKVPSGGAVSVEFPFARERTRLNEDYEVAIGLLYPGGREESFTGRVNFRGVEMATKPITIDADLADWDLDALLPLLPTWQWELQSQGNTGPAKHYCQTWAKQTESEGKFKMYLRWDRAALYLAAVTFNTQPSRTDDLDNLWAADCLYVMLYPDEFTPGGGTSMRPYKMHLAMDRAGRPMLQDGDGKIWKPEELGVEYAARYTPTGYVYEFKMGPKYLRGMKLRPGQRFSMSALCWSKHSPKYAFYRHCASFDGGVADMAQFTLVGE